jgi:hypothetical protein
MKKILITFGILLVCALGLNAAAPTASLYDAYSEFGGTHTLISSKAAYDSIGGIDTVTIASNVKFENGWRYVLIRDAFTGSSSDSDSVNVVVNVEALDASGNLLYSTPVDTFKTPAGEAVDLTIGTAVFGDKYRIKLIGITGNGGKVIINRLRIVKWRPVVLQKNY